MECGFVYHDVSTLRMSALLLLFQFHVGVIPNITPSQAFDQVLPDITSRRGLWWEQQLREWLEIQKLASLTRLHTCVSPWAIALHCIDRRHGCTCNAQALRNGPCQSNVLLTYSVEESIDQFGIVGLPIHRWY